MKIDLSCPVEAWKVSLPRPNDSQCVVKLFNLADLPVVSVEVTITLSSADEEESAKITHRSRGLQGTPGKIFYMEVPVEQRIRAEVYEITVDKVWFDNSSVWRRERDAAVEYIPNNLRRSPQLTTLRSIAGDMASGYPDQQDGLWVCVCGRPNLDHVGVCVRCHREKEDVFRRYNRDAIQAAVSAIEDDLTARGHEVLVRNHANPDPRGKDHVHRRKRRRGRVLKTVVALVSLGVILWGGWFHLVPRVRFELATYAYQQADSVLTFEQAENAFQALDDYRSAAEMAERSRFARALAYLGMTDESTAIAPETSEDDLLTARALLTSLQPSELLETADLRNAIPAYVRLCDAARADLLLQEERLDEAEYLYQTLGGDEAENRLPEIAYQRALELMAREEWTEAREILQDLGDYQDSAALVPDTWYLPGLRALEDGDIEQGLALLAQVPGHRDADERILQTRYEQGVALREAGRLDEAAEAFALAVGYLDAAEQANECFYAPAMDAYETFDYLKAAQLFGRIPEYRDAREKWSQSVRKAAEKAMSEIRYADAAALLAQLPADDAQAAALLLDCTYEPAKNAYVRGDYAAAVEGFAAIQNHRDSTEWLAKSRLALAEELARAGQYAEAEALYVLLGEYGNAPAKLQAVRYAQAETLLETGMEAELIEAAQRFAALGDYQDSPARLQQTQYALAGAYLARGDHAAARALYLSLGEYSDAAAQLQACDYVLAETLAATDPAAALTAFEALGDYRDAPDRANALRYAAAEALAATDPEAAIAAYDALGAYGDAAARANALRYAAAEALVATDRDAAIRAFKALGDYADASDREKQLRYEDAEALLATNRAAALTAFRALGDYHDAPERVAALRYEDAEALAKQGDWEEAANIFASLPDYRDSVARADQLRYDAAIAFAEAGRWTEAQAAFAAMSNGENADEQVNALRYAAAEELLAAGQKETAAAAFAAIGAYRDASDRANALRYEAAEALIPTDWRAAAAAFEAISDYKDAADRAKKVRYDAADALAAAGEWDAAIETFTALGDYSNSPDRVRQLQYNAAAALAAAGRWDDAVAAFTALGDYADSKTRISRTRLEQAAAVAESGDLLGAAAIYDTLGSYQDADQKAMAMRDQHYGSIATTVAIARENRNYTHMYLLLRSVELQGLPEKYTYLQELYREACYHEGNRLYGEGRPYEAYACYAELPAKYKDIDAIMQRPCYMILGTWTDLNGKKYLFDGSGTCRLNGESFYFNVDGTDVYTGKDITALEATHRLSGVTKKNAWLHDLRDGSKVYLTRVVE